MDEQTTPQTPEKPAKEKRGKKRTRRIILVIVLLLLLLLGGVFAYRHFVGVQPNDTVLLEENIKAYGWHSHAAGGETRLLERCAAAQEPAWAGRFLRMGKTNRGVCGRCGGFAEYADAVDVGIS